MCCSKVVASGDELAFDRGQVALEPEGELVVVMGIAEDSRSTERDDPATG